MKHVTIENVKARIDCLENIQANTTIGISLREEFELACFRQLLASMEQKPFMYGIADPDGNAHMDEMCVSQTPSCVEDAVACLNEHNTEVGEPLYQVVPLYRNPVVSAQQPGLDDDVRNIIGLLERNEWAEHCTSTALGSRLESEITRLVGRVQPVPVASDADPSFDAMMRALDAFYADDDVPERAMLAAFKILVADVRSQRGSVVDEIAEQQGFNPKIADAYMQGWHDRENLQSATDNTAQQFEALATSAGSGTVTEIKPANSIDRFGNFTAREGHSGKILLDITHFHFGNGTVPEAELNRFTPKYMLQGIINRLQKECDQMAGVSMINLLDIQFAGEKQEAKK